jgi:hypothetical protein
MASGYDMYDPGFNSVTRRRNEDHSKYFEKDNDTGEYVLREGYEQRYLGSGDNVSRGGAESTFSNDYDDLHDSYEPDRDKKIYGIYKTPEAVSPEEEPAPSEAPQIEAEPEVNPLIQLSQRAAEANAEVAAYENQYLPRQGGATIRNDASVVQDYKNNYQLNLIDELKAKAPGTLNNTKNAIQMKDVQTARTLQFT